MIPACLLASASTVDRAKPKHKSPIPQAQAQPAPPPVPLVPEQMPASPPQVGFAQGQLTISAQNSTLGDILRAVRKQTGASVEVPGNATERVVGKFGPGPARDVLTALLNGSHFNYVLLGSATDPAALDRVVLISRSAVQAEDQPNAFAQNHPGQPQPVASGDGPEQDLQAEDAPDVPDSADTSGDDQTQAEEAATPQQPTPLGQPGVRTPEQLLQELQQRQQQGIPAPPAPGFPGPNAPN